jgi:hypothetical protein
MITNMPTNNHLALVDYMLKLWPEEVLDLFSELPGAVKSIRKDLSSYVYIPGNREDRVLLIAHVDTVFARPPKTVTWVGNIAVNGDYGKGSGLGADDRAGCAMLWAFRESGHSLLLVDGEESGCVGSSHAALEMEDVLADHQFAIEIDRRGDQEMVFYDCATQEFKDWIFNEATAEWGEGIGAFTDISAVCPEVGICGVNLAAGYMYQHTSDEVFFLDAWERTRDFLDHLLNYVMEIPKFILPRRSTYFTSSLYQAFDASQHTLWELDKEDVEALELDRAMGKISDEDWKEYYEDYVAEYYTARDLAWKTWEEYGVDYDVEEVELGYEDGAPRGGGRLHAMSDEEWMQQERQGTPTLDMAAYRKEQSPSSKKSKTRKRREQRRRAKSFKSI